MRNSIKDLVETATPVYEQMRIAHKVPETLEQDQPQTEERLERGILIGLALSLPLWALLFAAWWFWIRG